MSKRDDLIRLIKEMRQELINKGSNITQGEVIALLVVYDSLLNELTLEEREVA